MRAPSRPSNPNSSAWDEVDAEDTPLEGSEEAPARTWSSKRFGLHQHAKMGAALALAALAAPLPILVAPQLCKVVWLWGWDVWSSRLSSRLAVRSVPYLWRVKLKGKAGAWSKACIHRIQTADAESLRCSASRCARTLCTHLHALLHRCQLWDRQKQSTCSHG